MAARNLVLLRTRRDRVYVGWSFCHSSGRCHGRLRFTLMRFLSVLPRRSRGALVLYKGGVHVCMHPASSNDDGDRTPASTPQLLHPERCPQVPVVPHLLSAPHATAHRAADRPDPNPWKLLVAIDRAHDPPLES